MSRPLRLVAWACLLIALLGLWAPAAAAEVSGVATGDSIVGRSFVKVRLIAGYFDADEDGRFDVSEPDEPLYLHIGIENDLDWGDLRLTPHGPHAAGTAVAITNADLGRPLTVPGTGWFGVTTRGAWYFDTDGSWAVSPGDVRFGSAIIGEKVRAGDADVGTSIKLVQVGVRDDQRGGFLDADRDGRYDPGETIILDVDNSGDASPGDARITISGMSDEPVPGPGTQPSNVDALRSDLEARDAALEDRITDLEDQVAELSRDLLALQAGQSGGGPSASGNGAASESPGIGLVLLGIAMTVAAIVRPARRHE